MTIQSKSYMNFLGGEVSPNAYKRLDMANNSKWFETAKNIYFGTTGDFHNRRGFKYIGKTANGISNEKIKLIPFLFNKDNSYCVEFNSNTFRILKDGQLLKDQDDNIINIRHDGVSSSSIDDISYAQVGDILYIATGGTNRIYTITRFAENDWRWDEFNYSIPPMRKINDNDEESLLFAENTSYGVSGQFQINVSSYMSTLDDAEVFIKENDTWTSIYQASADFASWENFVLDFNSNQTASTKILTCRYSGGVVSFYCTSTGSDIQAIRIVLGPQTRQEKTYNFPGNPFSGNNAYSGISYSYDGGNRKGNVFYNCPSTALVKSINGRGISYSGQVEFTFSNQYISPNFATPSQVASAINRGGRYAVSYDSSNNRFSCVFRENRGAGVFQMTEIKNYVTLEIVGSSVTMETSTRIAGELSQNIYNVSANFDFFENKEVGEIFAVDSLFSPTKDGKAGENKSYFGQNLSTGTIETDSFWSNGNWRIVTSGLFDGSIELQYSYDGSNWYTHRTFSSSIRSESGVSYGTNYNEYGTIDADDNILLRLRISISSATRLSVLLDTESFKNRSYYQILEKDSSTPNTKVIAKCVFGAIGTPGITKESADPGIYDVNRISEWSESAWSYKNGYPKIVFLYQNRLAFANTLKDPQTIWFSRTDNYKDFATKVEYQDDDPITISVLKPTGISEITGIAASKKLFVFTRDREYGIKDEGALTQANKELVSFSTYGSEPIETRVVSNRVVFVEEGARAARALIYDYAQENYEAPDLTIPYKHLLTNETIVATEYLAGEYKCYLMLTSSGRLLMFKYVPDQKIEACSWFRHAHGDITNICMVTTANSYDLYVCVDSGDYKYLEYMKIIPYQTGVYLDSFKDFSYAENVSSITDSEYFEPNKEYAVMIDGIFYKVIADNNNTILLPKETNDCTVGLPYQSEGTLIEPNLMFQNGTTNYNRKNMFKAHFEFIDSCGFKVGIKNKNKGFKKVYALEATSVEGQHNLYSDSRSFALQSSYLEPNMLSFVQDEPYPMHIVNAEVEVDYGGK